MATTTVPAAQLQEYGPNQSQAASISAVQYGARTMQGLTSLQMEYDGDALAIAQNYSVWYRNPIPRVQQMTLDSFANGGNNISQMLGRQLLDRLTIEYQGQTAGPTFQQDSLIESITHTIQMDQGPSWVTRFAMSPYEILMQPTILGLWTFDSGPENGVLTL